MTWRKHAILFVILPFGSKSLHSQQTIVPEGCSDDQSFYDWRHCEIGDVSHLREAQRRPLVTKESVGCVVESAMSSPSQAQRTHDRSETQMSQILSSIAQVTDMVYVLCVNCHALRVPQDLNNIILIDGRASDQCLRPAPLHDKKVAFAHKAAVAHAASQNFSNLTIIEEDLVINPMYKQLPDLTDIARQIQMRLAENNNQIVRFTSLPWHLNGSPGTCKDENCKCIGVTPDLCVLRSGCQDVHDSSFYMLPDSMFSTFIAANFGGFDLGNFAAFDSILVTPPITLQTHFACGFRGIPRQCGMEVQGDMWRKYNRTCVVPASAGQLP